MSEPLFSVIIPSYNRRHLLAEAVASVSAQSLGDWELLIVDDGSDDGTAEAFAEHQDPRVRLLVRPHNGIIGQVRNVGARHARGRYLAFLDSDDLWYPTKLEAQHAAFGRTGATWSYTGYDVVSSEGGRVLGVYRPRGLSGAGEALLLGLLTTDISAATSSLAFERRVFERLGGFSDHYRSREDIDLVLRMAEAGEPRVEVAETLASIREHGRRSDFGERDPCDRSALVYEHFLERHPRAGVVSRRARAVARRVLAGHRIASARIDFADGDRRSAHRKLRQVWNPGWRLPRWWLGWLGWRAARR